MLRSQKSSKGVASDTPETRSFFDDMVAKGCANQHRKFNEQGPTFMSVKFNELNTNSLLSAVYFQTVYSTNRQFHFLV